MTKSKITSHKKHKKVSAGGATPADTEAMDSITMATSVSKTQKKQAKALKASLGRARGICWTLYNYDQYLPSLASELCRYIVYGKEICPDTKRPHLQGFVYYDNAQSLDAFSTFYGDCHVEKMWSTPQIASDYCKEDGDFTERGELPKQGKRTDWGLAMEQLSTMDVTDVIQAQPQLLPCQRALREYKALLLKPLHRNVTVYVLYGEAGSGKSRWAYEHDPKLFSKPPEKQSGTYFDGYSGQKTLLLDDYYGGIKYCDLLRILDIYPYSAPVSGGFIQAQWDTVIITSNKDPTQWYTNHGLTAALRRRINKCFYVSSIDGETQYEEQADFQKEGTPTKGET